MDNDDQTKAWGLKMLELEIGDVVRVTETITALRPYAILVVGETGTVVDKDEDTGEVLIKLDYAHPGLRALWPDNCFAIYPQAAADDGILDCLEVTEETRAVRRPLVFVSAPVLACTDDAT